MIYNSSKLLSLSNSKKQNDTLYTNLKKYSIGCLIPTSLIGV